MQALNGRFLVGVGFMMVYCPIEFSPRHPMSTVQPTFDDTWRLLQETEHKIDKLGNRLADFVKHSVRPAVVRLFRERGIDFHEIRQRP